MVASATFPAAAEMLAELLPDDEIIVGHERADGHADVIVPLMSRIDAGMMDRLRPRLIQQFGVGLEGVDLDAARERGIEVANVPAGETGNADGVGEVAVLHLLAVMRRLRESAKAVADGRLGEPLGTPLIDASLVVLGLGAVGQAVVRRLSGFGARLTGVGSRDPAGLSPAVSALALDRYVPVAKLTDALRGADALIVCCTLNDRTRGLIGADQLAVMRRGAFVVNVARGPVIEYDALLASLRSGQIAGAGLDVYWDEPIDPDDPLLAENVSATPHIGGVTTFSYRRIAEHAAANIERIRSD